MNRKKKQEPNKHSGNEAFDDIEDEDVVWEDDDWSGDPAERPPRKAKGHGREKDARPGSRRRSLDDDLVDGG